jgi:hypothetical protein
MSLELEYEPNDLYLELMLRPIYQSKNFLEINKKECVVCGGVEKNWDLYQYPCFHYGHTRCVRKWLVTKKKIQCPWCQYLTPLKKSCRTCQKWSDHCDLDPKICPKVREFYM